MHYRIVIRPPFECTLKLLPLCLLLLFASLTAQSSELLNTIDSEDSDADMHNLVPGLKHGDKRPAEQYTIELFDRPLTIGGDYEAFLGYPDDVSFDYEENGSVYYDHSLSAEIYYEISDSTSFYADASIFDTEDEDSNRRRITGIERGQAWLLFEEIFDTKFDIKIGPQYFSDEREWWYDAVIDGISIQYWGNSWQAELDFTEALGRTSTTDDRLNPEEEDLFRILVRVSWEFSSGHWMEYFYIRQYDHSRIEQIGEILDADRKDDTDADLQWFGLRTYGYHATNSLGGIDYWLDIGYLYGDETDIETSEVNDNSERLIVDDVETSAIRGWAIDLGATWETELPLSPSITLGYAIASGKANEERDLEYAYQQTGLEGNEDTFGDSNWLLYYGALLNPELSNLKIWTLGVGIPIMSNSSINLLYHRYNQYKPADFLRNAAIDESPSGRNTDIGEEIDVIVNIEEWNQWEFEFIAAKFKAGSAFETNSGEIISKYLFRLNYYF